MPHENWTIRVSGYYAVGQFVEHYHSEGNHQGLANRLIEPELGRDNGTGKVVCESRLGGLLNHYRRAA
ncbi:MAG: putative transposase [Verrucomicrobiales bacterium]|jgi:putative transposase